MEHPSYQIAAVARLTGISADVIRSWERRYGLIRPQRDASGVRMYSDAEVARLKLARQATERGHPIRKVAVLADDAIAALLEAGRREPEPDAGAAAEAGVVTAVLAALRDADAERAKRTLISAALLMEPRELVLRVLAPLMREVGFQWQRGELAVWQEHLLSGIVSSVAGALSRLSGAASSETGMVLATPPGEPHAFGIAFGAMLASARGLRAYNLGPNVPAGELAGAAARLRARFVVVGITRTDADASASLRFAEELDAALPRGIGLWIGGPASRSLAAGLGSPRVRALATLEELAAALDVLD